MSVKAPTLPHCVWSLPPKGDPTGIRRLLPWGGLAAKPAHHLANWPINA